jgi:hypothetical protein
MRSLPALCAAVSVLPASLALADSDAWVQTPATASMVVTVQLTITTALGTSSDSDTRTVAVTGAAHTDLIGPDPAWTSCSLDTLAMFLANSTFHFDLYCFPFIGCQALDVTLVDVSLTQLAPASAPLTAAGNFSAAGFPVRMQGGYSTTGVATASGVFLNDTVTNLAGRVRGQPKQTVLFDQLSMSPVTTVIDPASLPAGVTALTVTLSPNLANTTMSGHYTIANPYDLDGDGAVGAGDIATLLNAWGTAGPGDFNANGVVDAPDLSVLLANWTA